MWKKGDDRNRKLGAAAEKGELIINRPDVSSVTDKTTRRQSQTKNVPQTTLTRFPQNIQSGEDLKSLVYVELGFGSVNSLADYVPQHHHRHWLHPAVVAKRIKTSHRHRHPTGNLFRSGTTSCATQRPTPNCVVFWTETGST